jgi:prophage regulatory protein
VHPAEYRKRLAGRGKLERSENETNSDRGEPPSLNGVRAPPLDEFMFDDECQRVTRLSRSTRWRLQKQGLFPKRRQISPGRIAWLRSEIAAWVASRQKVA